MGMGWGWGCKFIPVSIFTYDVTHTPVSRSNGQRSWLQMGAGIPCWLNLAATLFVCYDFKSCS